MRDWHLDGISEAVATAIDVARGLTEPGDESNPEYTRGQAELICDLFGLSMDEHRDKIIAVIGGDSGYRFS